MFGMSCCWGCYLVGAKGLCFVKYLYIHFKMHTHSNQSNQRQRKCSINSNKLLWNAFLYRKHLRFFLFFFGGWGRTQCLVIPNLFSWLTYMNPGQEKFSCLAKEIGWKEHWVDIFLWLISKIWCRTRCFTLKTLNFSTSLFEDHAMFFFKKKKNNIHLDLV